MFCILLTKKDWMEGERDNLLSVVQRRGRMTTRVFMFVDGVNEVEEGDFCDITLMDIEKIMNYDAPEEDLREIEGMMLGHSMFTEAGITIVRIK